MYSTRYRFAFMFLLGGYSFVNTLMLESFEYYHINANKLIIFLVFIAVTVGIWEGNRLWDNWVSSRQFTSFWKRISYNFAGSVVITALVHLLFGVPAAFLTLPGDWHQWILPLKLLLMFCFRVNLFLNTIHVIFLYHQQLEQSHQQIENYKRITTQAQLQSLRNQVNPHFLFNNLSVLSALILQDANKSVEFVRQFSNVYRYILKSDEKEIIELHEELDFIQSYLYLLRTRFESGLSIEVDIAEGCLSAYIIPASLQMLVENAVKHNIISKNKPLRIQILCRDNETITVQNNLQRKIVEERQSTQIGLTNIARRYDFLGHHGVKVEETGNTFSVTIPLIRLGKERLINT